MHYVNSLWSSFGTLSSCWLLLKADNFLEKAAIIAHRGLYIIFFFFSRKELSSTSFKNLARCIDEACAFVEEWVSKKVGFVASAVRTLTVAFTETNKTLN